MRAALLIAALGLSGCVGSLIEAEMTWEGEAQDLYAPSAPRDAELDAPRPADAAPPSPDAPPLLDPCAEIECDPYERCLNGLCLCVEGADYNEAGECAPTIPDDPCSSDADCDPGEICGGGACVADPCAGVSCPPRSQCEAGACVCEPGYHLVGAACVADAPCGGGCRADQACVQGGCVCPEGFTEEAGACVPEVDPCEGQACSDHGACVTHHAQAGWIGVCVCDAGFTPTQPDGLDCAPTEVTCVGVTLLDEAGEEITFEPTADECALYEGINRARASNAAQPSEAYCFTPLAYAPEWSYVARGHAEQMSQDGALGRPPNLGVDGGYMGIAVSVRDVDSLVAHYADQSGCPDPESPWCAVVTCRWSTISLGYLDGWHAAYLIAPN